MREVIHWVLGLIAGLGIGWGAHRDFRSAPPIAVYDYSGDRGYIGCDGKGRGVVRNITIALLPRVPMKPIIDIGAIEDACAPLEMRQ